jgi:hypothetical protein
LIWRYSTSRRHLPKAKSKEQYPVKLSNGFAVLETQVIMCTSIIEKFR